MHEQHYPARPSGVRASEPVRAYAAMNTVRALERLAFTPMSVPELADSLQVSVRNTRRLLKRLALEGFVIQERRHRRRYHTTLRLAALGRQMLDHVPLATGAVPRVAALAKDTSSVAHLWIAGYYEQVVCAVHAGGRAGDPTVSVLSEVASAPSSAAGTVLLGDRAELRSSCYLHLTGEPMFAAAVLERGRVVAALGVTGEGARPQPGCPRIWDLDPRVRLLHRSERSVGPRQHVDVPDGPRRLAHSSEDPATPIAAPCSDRNASRGPRRARGIRTLEYPPPASPPRSRWTGAPRLGGRPGHFYNSQRG